MLYLKYKIIHIFQTIYTHTYLISKWIFVWNVTYLISGVKQQSCRRALMCRSSCFLFWGQSWAVGGWVLSRAAISLELTALSPWVRERKDWGNYLPLKKIDEAKCATRKQYAGSNLSPLTATVIFFLQVPAIYGVDTRMLTKIIRDKVRSSSLAESLSLLILPRCMKDSLIRKGEKPGQLPLLSPMSLSFTLRMWSPGLNIWLPCLQLGGPEINFPGRNLLSAYYVLIMTMGQDIIILFPRQAAVEQKVCRVCNNLA